MLVEYEQLFFFNLQTETNTQHLGHTQNMSRTTSLYPQKDKISSKNYIFAKNINDLMQVGGALLLYSLPKTQPQFIRI